MDIEECLKSNMDIDEIKEKVIKYGLKYKGSLNEAVYLTRIDAIQMFGKLLIIDCR